MLEFAPTPAPSAPTPKRTKRTLKDKEATKERLEKELAEDLAATDGAARIYFPPGRKGNSRNPNESLMFDFVDDGFLNRTAHQEAVAIMEAWKPAPWKGMVWQAQRNIDRVWTGPTHHDLQWDGQEWMPVPAAHDALGAVDTYFAYSASSTVPVKATAALLRAIERGNSGGITEEEVNAAYVEYAADPVGQKESWFVTLSAFVRTTKRIKQVNNKFKNLPEIYMDTEDIFSEFAINLMHRIESEQYTHEGKMQNWIGSIWGNFFFPEVQTEIFGYADRNTYVNMLDPDLDEYEFQNHAVALLQVEDEQAQRAEAGYAVPISRDKIFRQLSKPVQDIVQMLCEGMTQDEIAVNLGISPRHLRRILPTIQACADEPNLLPWPSLGLQPDGTYNLNGSADEPSNSLAGMVEEYETAITVQQLATILQCSRGQIYKLIDEKRLPALRVGTLVRLDPAQIAEWIRSKMTIAA
jgi:excisionase family DNA binding protein